MCSIIGVGERLHNVWGQTDLGTLDSGERSLPFELLVFFFIKARHDGQGVSKQVCTGILTNSAHNLKVNSSLHFQWQTADNLKICDGIHDLMNHKVRVTNSPCKCSIQQLG